MGIIYCYTNKNTGKKYIGQTINPDQRKRNHLHEATKTNSQYYFHRSIRKHGWEAFEYDVLEETDDLSHRESFWIKELNTLWPNGYNEILDHNVMSDETRKKISKTKKMRCSMMTEEEKKSMTQKMIDSNRGRKKSEESKRKTSESIKKHLAQNPRKGKKWTPEMKERQSQLLKEKFKNGIGRWANT